MTERRVSVEEWMPRARRLSDTLVAAGKLHSPAWIDSFSNTPRHSFTPDVLWPNPDGSWYRLDNDTDEHMSRWLDRVYSNEALLTKEKLC